MPVIGVPAVVSRLLALPGTVTAAGAVGMARTVAAGEGVVKGNASGRPGPRVVTGAHRRSIRGQVLTVGGGIVEGEIGASSPQAARLEFPFYGPDSLGRRFPGNTYPYLAPSLPQVAAIAEREIGGAVTAAIG